MNQNFLANLMYWLGDVFEKFNPAAFRFLAAFLPYLTPFPVAILTATSASEFLNLKSGTSFILVFSLEGIGLWFTSLFVESVVDWITSRNAKTFALILLFGTVVAVYVYILVSLNVTLKGADGELAPAMKRVVTLLCFLPLLTGVGNGYYKLKLDRKSETEKIQEFDRQTAEKIRKEKQDERILKYKIRHGVNSGTTSETSETNETNTKVPKQFRKHNGSSVRTGRPSIHEQRVYSYIETYRAENGSIPSYTEVEQTLNLSPATASRLRNKWIEENE